MEFFAKKIDFCLMPTRNQNLQWAWGGGGISVPLVETDIKIEFGMSKMGGLHPSLVQTERQMQKPYFCHQNLVFSRIK